MDGDSSGVIVILTALNLEFLSVRRFLTPLRQLGHPAGTVFEIGRLPGRQGLIALAVTGEGNTAAAVLAERAIAMFRPRALLFVGVAGALRDDIALGDVVVATKVYAYHGGDVQPGGFRARPRCWEIPHQLDQAARRIHRTGSWISLLPAGPPQRVPTVHFRPVAAGEVVLNSRHGSLAEHLRSSYGDAVAIEMESAGVAHAAHLNDGLPVACVLGISDKADGAKREADRQGWQRTAATNAAAFAVAVAAGLGTSADERLTTLLQAWPGLADLTVPRQLPVSGQQLVGRAGLLSRLDEVLRRPGGQQARIVVLTGMAGAGKTALAVRWAHAATDAFPDGQLYADVRGFGPDPPLHAQEILAGFLRALGQSQAAERGTLDERAARLRTALSERRMIIVLDNVASIEQIRLLLPGTGSCAVLVTSRERLRGLAVHHSAQVLEVDRLPARDAAALLCAAIGERAAAKPGQVALLAARCGGLPLALRIAAEMMISHPGRGLAVLADELGDGDTALDLLDTGDDPYSAVRTVFFWSYRALEVPVAAAFRLLGLHPSHAFALSTVAALLNVPAARARAMLRALVNAHLVIETADGRFEMHDLLRTYAQELCTRTDDQASRRAAVNRMFDQYLHTADLADQVIMPYRYRVALDGAATIEPGFGSRQLAARWFDQERYNLVELCRIEAPEFDSRRWQLAYVLRDYFYLSKHLDGWVETHRLAVAGCQRLGDRRAEGITRNNLGRALLEIGQVEAAAAQYRWAGSLLQEAGDEHGVTDALVNLASILRRQGACDEALRDQLTALAFYQRAGLSRKIGITLRSIARTELALGRLTDAAGHAEEALARFVDLGLDLDAAQSLNALMLIQHEGGDADNAEATGRRAIDYSRRADSDYEEAQALHQLGTVAARAGRPEVARQRWTEALAILGRLGAVMAETVRSELRDLAEQ
ncbi:MAG TPA: tetratricopeptide repeat protein [Streptosporangiaceae bacterium]